MPRGKLSAGRVAFRPSSYSGIRSATLPQRESGVARGANKMAIWLIVVGMFMPTIQVYLGAAKFTPARIAIALLLIPALARLLRKGRQVMASDVFACATSAWMLGASAAVDGTLHPSAIAQVLEFLGAYTVARAYVFGRPAQQAFIQAFKVVTITLIVLATFDTVSGRVIVHDTFATLFSMPPLDPQYREGLVRAASTFDSPILFGAFCTIAAAILLYSERGPIGRIIYGGLCFFGCVLALSSAPLLSFVLVVSLFLYDTIMKKYAWRWKVFIAAVIGLVLTIFALANRPISWIVAHLTLDPSTGYFRIATWDHALENIWLSPLVGYAFNEYGDAQELFDRASVDSVWLVFALRFGVPMVFFLLLTNVAVVLRSKTKAGNRTRDQYMDNMRMAFTLVIITFVFTGLTVHFWNAVWAFWGLSIGICASLKEYHSRVRAYSP